MPDAKPKTKVLFVCTGNACRSQMAEGWTRARWGDRIEVHSAGVMPCGRQQPHGAVMKEAGVDISKHTSKHVRDVAHIPFDFVITVCGYADQRCPTVPGGGKRIHRPFDDPPTLSSSRAVRGGGARPSTAGSGTRSALTSRRCRRCWGYRSVALRIMHP